MSGQAKDRLRVVCTDRRTHPARELGLIDWTPDASEGSVWDPADDPTQQAPQALAAAGRQTRAGSWSTVDRAGRVRTVTRADGGVTFHFRACLSCRTEYALRDDTLSVIRRTIPSGRWDASFRIPVK